MNRVIHGDCLEVMDKLIKDGVKVDAIITDPPYGTTACKWDSVISFDEMWQRLKMLRKEKTPIVLFGSEPFSSALRMSNIKEFKYDWIWDKGKTSNPLLAKKQPMKKHEIIHLFYKNQCLYNPIGTELKNEKTLKREKRESGYMASKSTIYNWKPKYRGVKKSKYKYPESIIKFKKTQGNNQFSKEAHKHPTQKPVKLIEYLIKTYTNENDLVLDFTAGSGTTGIACQNLNRKYILIEKEKKYIDIINNRLKENNNHLFNDL